MKQLLRCTAYHLLRTAGVISHQRSSRVLKGRGTAAVLVFHSINPQLPEDGVTIRPHRFRRILETLVRHYRPISLRQVADQLRRGEGFNGDEVCVTFDDGYLDNFEHAAPALHEFNVPACFFLTVGHIGKQHTFWWDAEKGRASHMMDWAQARELASLGFELGCHTWSHADLGEEPIASAEREVVHARTVLQQETGQPVDSFAYPYGGLGNITSDWIDFIRGAGFQCICSAANDHVTGESDRFCLPRIGASPQRSVTELRIDIDQPW